MPDITRLSVQSYKKKDFMIKRMHYIESKEAIINKAFANEYIISGDYKFIGFFNNPKVSSKKRIFTDQISLKCEYM